MSRVSTYLNFTKNTEEVFNFYKSVFGGKFVGQTMRMGDVPSQPGMPPIMESEKNLIMHMELSILDGHRLMGTDAPESMGMKVIQGNNIHIMLEPGTKDEAKKLFTALSDGGKITMPLEDMFWGSYYGSCLDKYGVQWMVNVPLMK